MNTMRVEDFVVLGRTVPEDSRKYGQKVCMAGYSPSNNQFLRVYPLLVPVGKSHNANGFRARHTYVLDLKRNPSDSRTESWRVSEEQKPTTTVWETAKEIQPDKLRAWLEKRIVPSIRSLDDCRMSIGVLRVAAGRWQGVTVPRESQIDSEPHRTLFDDLDDQAQLSGDANLISKVKFAPYIHFADGCGDHKLQVREWGAYLLLAKDEYVDRPQMLWGASGYRTGRDLYLVIGNMMNHRKNWLIIKTFEVDAPDTSPSLLDGIEDGQSE